MNFIQSLRFYNFLIKYSKWPPKVTSFQTFKSQYLIYSLTDLNKICAKMFALTGSLVLKVLLLYIAFSFNYISTSKANTLLFLLTKCENPLHCKGFSHFISKNNSVFVIFMLEILMIMILILNNRCLACCNVAYFTICYILLHIFSVFISIK